MVDETVNVCCGSIKSIHLRQFMTKFMGYIVQFMSPSSTFVLRETSAIRRTSRFCTLKYNLRYTFKGFAVSNSNLRNNASYASMVYTQFRKVDHVSRTEKFVHFSYFLRVFLFFSMTYLHR